MVHPEPCNGAPGCKGDHRWMEVSGVSEDDTNSWAMARLDEFIDMTSSRNLSSSGSGYVSITNRRGSKAPRSDVLERVDAIERILDRHYPEWRDRRQEWADENYEFEDIRTAAIRCRARLIDAAEVAAHLGPSGPTLRVDRLHPWVWDAAKQLWSDGHHQDAVAAAAEAVDRHVCAKIDNRERKGARLYNNAYSAADPRPGEPRTDIADGNDLTSSQISEPQHDLEIASPSAPARDRDCG
jgi:hypothetical protein